VEGYTGCSTCALIRPNYFSININPNPSSYPNPIPLPAVHIVLAEYNSGELTHKNHLMLLSARRFRFLDSTTSIRLILTSNLTLFDIHSCTEFTGATLIVWW